MHDITYNVVQVNTNGVIKSVMVPTVTTLQPSNQVSEPCAEETLIANRSGQNPCEGPSMTNPPIPPTGHIDDPYALNSFVSSSCQTQVPPVRKRITANLQVPSSHQNDYESFVPSHNSEGTKDQWSDHSSTAYGGNTSDKQLGCLPQSDSQLFLSESMTEMEKELTSEGISDLEPDTKIMSSQFPSSASKLTNTAPPLQIDHVFSLVKVCQVVCFRIMRYNQLRTQC